MLLRPATLADLPALSQLAQQTYSHAFGHSCAPADLAAHLAKNLSPRNFEQMLAEDTISVAEVDGQLVGCVQFGRADMPDVEISEDAQELRRLYVLPRFQSQGIGAQLMQAALEHPQLRNAPSIVLDVWEHNPGAQRFYARHGFKVIGQRQFVVESGGETSLDLIMARQ